MHHHGGRDSYSKVHLPPRSSFSSNNKHLSAITLPHTSSLPPNLYTTPTTYKMSAPNGGRQSPEPENQSARQQGQPPASNPNNQGAAPSDTHAQEASKEQLKNFSSNPEPALQKFSDEKTSKSHGN